MKQKVWMAWFINEDPEIYGTAEKAYNAIKDYIEANYDDDDNIDEILKELKEDYVNYPDSFGVEDVAGALAYFVQ